MFIQITLSVKDMKFNTQFKIYLRMSKPNRFYFCEKKLSLLTGKTIKPHQ